MTDLYRIIELSRKLSCNLNESMTPVDAHEVFGGDEYVAVRKLGYRFSEKPGYLSDIKAEIPEDKIAKLESAIGRKIKQYPIKDILPRRNGEYYPQDDPLISPSEMEDTFIVYSNEGTFLVNNTGARSYFRMWARIV